MSMSKPPGRPRWERFLPGPGRLARPPKPARPPMSAGVRPDGALVSRAASARLERRKRRRRASLLTLGALVAVSLIIWGIAALSGAGGPKTVPSTDYARGDCFADFDATASSGNKVDCTQSHSAQLVGIEKAASGEAYPGRDSLEQRAAQQCKGPDIELPADTSRLKQRYAYPSQDGWAGGDRRIDCYIVSTEGNTLTASFLR